MTTTTFEIKVENSVVYGFAAVALVSYASASIYYSHSYAKGLRLQNIIKACDDLFWSSQKLEVKSVTLLASLEKLEEEFCGSFLDVMVFIRKEMGASYWIKDVCQRGYTIPDLLGDQLFTTQLVSLISYGHLAITVASVAVAASVATGINHEALVAYSQDTVFNALDYMQNAACNLTGLLCGDDEL